MSSLETLFGIWTGFTKVKERQGEIVWDFNIIDWHPGGWFEHFTHAHLILNDCHIEWYGTWTGIVTKNFDDKIAVEIELTRLHMVRNPCQIFEPKLGTKITIYYSVIDINNIMMHINNDSFVMHRTVPR